MKDRYVGDVNDFYKYALLRELAAVHDGRLVVGWMHTPPDARPDGRHLGYLERPQRYRPVDPHLFDRLGALVRGGQRSVAAVEAAGIVPAAIFWSDLLCDGATERARWFAGLRATWRPRDLVFLDPDNGLEVPSVPPGRRNASKYVYRPELVGALDDSRSVCVYQHFARRERTAYVRELAERIRATAPGREVAAVLTPRAAFLLAGGRQSIAVLRQAAEQVGGRCAGEMSVLST